LQGYQKRDEHHGLSIIYENGTFDFINEIVYNDPSEENFKFVARLHIVEDAKQTFLLYQELVASFS